MVDTLDFIDIACSPEEAYKLVATPENHLVFTTSIVEIRNHVGGEVTVGDLWMFVNNFIGHRFTATYTVIEATPPSKFVYESKSEASEIRTTWEFSPIDNGTRVLLGSKGHVKGVLTTMGLRLVLGHYVKGLHRNLEAIKTILEAP